MSVLIIDLRNKNIEAPAANAMCNAAGKLLRIAELQHKFGALTLARDK